jgi:hypothetical protein
MIYGTPEFDNTLIKIIRPTGKDSIGYRHSSYEACCAHAREMAWHIYGEKPVELLKRTRPREDPEVTDYRIDNYEPTTKSAADKAINVISKIFNPNLYSIRWKNKSASAEEIRRYTLEYYPGYNSVVNYMKDVLLRKMLADPNGIAVAKLQVVPERDVEEVEPVLVIFGSENIWNYDSDHYLINTSIEKERNIKWFYFEYYDRTRYINFRAYVTPTAELVIDEIESYLHGFSEIPAWPLGGKSEALDNGEIMYKSFFDSAVPFWNSHIIHSSDLLGAYINHIYPQKYELSEACTYRWKDQYPCRQGKIKYEDGTTGDCPRCDGTGFRNMAGPYGVYKISKDKLSEGEPLGIDPIGYVNVPVDAAKMLEDRAREMLQKGMWAINMDVEDEIGENQSGVAKVIDRSAQYDTLYNMSTVIFDHHLQNTYYFFNKYMFQVLDNAPESNLPEINKPTQFDVYSTAELIHNFKAAKESGLDPNYLQIKQQEILTRDLTTNTDLKTFAFLLLDLDPLPGLDQMTISSNVMKGFNRQVDAVIHFNLKRFIERAIQEDRAFATKKKDEQIAILEKYGNELISQNKPKLDTTLLYADQTQTQPAA